MLQAATDDFVKTVVDKVQTLISEELRRRIIVIEASADNAIRQTLSESSEPQPPQTLDTGSMDVSVEETKTEKEHDGPTATAPASITATSTSRTEVPVVLWSSEIAAYMGQDSWQTRTQALARVWKRSHEPSFRDTREKWLLRGQKPLHFTSKQMIAEALNGISCNAGEVTKYHCFLDPFLRVQTSADVEQFRQTHQHKDIARLYQTKGKLLEEETAQLFEAEIGQPVRSRNAGVFWDSTASASGFRTERCSIRPPGPIVAPGTYRILGEIDACLLEAPFENVPVEFKLRMGENGVSDTIPFRDIIQVQSYMAILDASRGLHVQRAFGTNQLVTTTIMRDHHLWDSKVVPAIEEFVCDVRRLLRGSLADEELRHTVLLSVEASPAPPLFAFQFKPLPPQTAPPLPPHLAVQVQPQAQPQPTVTVAGTVVAGVPKKKRKRSVVVAGVAVAMSQKTKTKTRAASRALLHSPVTAVNYDLRPRRHLKDIL